MTTIIEAPVKVYSFIGIDPSLTGTGICVLPDGKRPFLKTITTTHKDEPNIYRRIKNIVRDVLSAVTAAKCENIRDFSICIEKSFVSPKNMASQQDLLNLAYVIRDQLYWHGFTWWDIAPSTLKKFVLGVGRGEKDMINKEVWKRWDIDAGNNNEADAAGLAKLAELIHLMKNGCDYSKWPRFQVDIARKLLEGK